MKKIFSNIHLWVVSLSMMMMACDSEPEVGSLLRDIEGNTQRSAYIQSLYPDNYAIWTGYQTPTGIVTNDDTLSFYVQLNGPAHKTTTFNVAADAEQAESYTSYYGMNYDVLDPGFIKVLNPTITIEAGNVKSTQPVQVVINDKNKLAEVAATGFMAFSFQPADTTIEAEGNYLMYLQVNKLVTNIKNNGTLEGIEMIPYSDFTFSATTSAFSLGRLKDGNIGIANSWTAYIYQWGTKPSLTCTFQQARTLKGIRWIPYNSYGTYGNNIQTLEVMTRESSTAEWVSQGVYNTDIEPTSQDPIDLQFLVPVQAKEVRITLQKGFKTMIGIAEMSLH